VTPGRWRRGSPESEDLPPAANIEPLAEGGFVSRLVLGLLVALVLALTAAPGSSAAPPQRIVSLSATATETLFAIGAGKQVVAVDDQSDYPRQAPRTSLSGFTPNVEAIVGYHPDLVVISYDPKGLSSALRQAGVRVLLQLPATTFAQAYGQIAALGRATGHERGAAVLVKRMRSRIAILVRAARARITPGAVSVYHEISPDYYSATSGSIIGAVYKLFGLKNIADATGGTSLGGVQLSAEYIVASKPDLIVLSDSRCCKQSRATVAQRPGWNAIPAVRRGTVAVIDDSIASRWGPRLVNFVRAVAIALRAVTQA
jgi:iron complex transport system substrate-binding protein